MLTEFLSSNKYYAITFIVVVVALIIFLFVKAMQSIGLEKIRDYVYTLFVKAEESFKYGENQDKFNYVVNLAKQAIPDPFNFFITEKLLRTVVQTWFDLVKDLLDDGTLNASSTKDK